MEDPIENSYEMRQIIGHHLLSMCELRAEHHADKPRASKATVGFIGLLGVNPSIDVLTQRQS
jgi:hypothetical protein